MSLLHHPASEKIPQKPVRFSAAVLAGGRSTRMGIDKAFLQVEDHPLLELQLQRLRDAGADELLLSGRPGVDYSAFPATIVYDERPDLGPIAGLAAALKTSSHSLLLVLAVDMPEMTAAMLRKILSRCEENLGCVPFDEDGFQPLAAAYPKAALPLAEQHLQDGTLSMQGFVKRAIAEGLMEALPLAPPEQLYFVNWNRPSDWHSRSG